MKRIGNRTSCLCFLFFVGVLGDVAAAPLQMHTTEVSANFEIPKQCVAGQDCPLGASWGPIALGDLGSVTVSSSVPGIVSGAYKLTIGM